MIFQFYFCRLDLLFITNYENCYIDDSITDNSFDPYQIHDRRHILLFFYAFDGHLQSLLCVESWRTAIIVHRCKSPAHLSPLICKSTNKSQLLRLEPQTSWCKSINYKLLVNHWAKGLPLTKQIQNNQFCTAKI